MSKGIKAVSKVYTGLIFTFLYAPIVILIVFSFNDSKSRSVWSGFTFEWYEKLFGDERIMSALRNTIIVAVISALVATLIGTMAAVGIRAMNKKLRNAVLGVTNITMVNPEIVTGVSMMLLFVAAIAVLKNFGLDAGLGLTTLILAHITFNIPYVILSVMPKLRQMNKHAYEAAMDLGCTPVKAFIKVVMPEIMPGVMTGLLMAFTMSIDDFVISYFCSTNSETLPILIYSMTKKPITPKINALSALMFVVVITLLLIVNIRQMREEDKTRKLASKAKGF